MPLLEVENITKRYGGLVANNGISFTVEAGQVLGIIGPNGAGKSTLFELITGFVPPDEGDVRLEGRSILGMREDRINRLGIARTFQKLKPFTQMSAEENVMIGILQHDANIRRARDAALTILEYVGLLEKRHVHAHGLSTGQRKRLELARAMATRPRLLLLDEVTGGVDQRSIPGLISLIEQLRHDGMTIVIIEHNMQVLMSLADRVVALHLGEKLAEGSPAAIQTNQKVIESYLGAAYA